MNMKLISDDIMYENKTDSLCCTFSHQMMPPNSNVTNVTDGEPQLIIVLQHHSSSSVFSGVCFQCSVS